tara:strand:- start:15 stop:326 length:312 start_codon:yes stop_codon:yes gene_type:complete
MNSLNDMTDWSYDERKNIPDQTYIELMAHLGKLHKEIDVESTVIIGRENKELSPDEVQDTIDDFLVLEDELHVKIKDLKQLVQWMLCFGLGVVCTTITAKVAF